MKRYLNTKTPYGIETIDELDSNDFNNIYKFYSELHKLKVNYNMTFHTWVYTSQRCTKAWKQNASSN